MIDIAILGLMVFNAVAVSSAFAAWREWGPWMKALHVLAVHLYLGSTLLFLWSFFNE